MWVVVRSDRSGLMGNAKVVMRLPAVVGMRCRRVGILRPMGVLHDLGKPVGICGRKLFLLCPLEMLSMQHEKKE